MTRSVFRISFGILLLVLALWQVWGCSHGITNPEPPGPSVSLLVNPPSVLLQTGQSIGLAAIIANWKKDSTVSWFIVANGSPAGALSGTGSNVTYTAPTALATDSIVLHVRARSNEDTVRYSDCIVTVTAQKQVISFSINPMSWSLFPGGSQQFQADYSGVVTGAVRWTLVSGPGTLSDSGLYVAPASLSTASASAVIAAQLLSDTTLHAQASITVRAQADDNIPCFRTVIQPIFVSHCSPKGCHNPDDHTHGVILSSYDGIMQTVTPGDTGKSLLWYRSAYVSKLSQDKLDNIAKWILGGAPNTQCPDMGSCDTSDSHYSTFIDPFFEYNCRGCHSDAFAFHSDNLDFKNYDSILPIALDGRLLATIQNPPILEHMPQYGVQLDSCTVAKIRAWINRGAPND